mmetsp:Transcript_14212/g.23648  ORF Transcript_14212/g.23648 Transcript_14212/m.23648 type:complete len:218 (-) Transcript_14212:1412-2065(-)
MRALEVQNQRLAHSAHHLQTLGYRQLLHHISNEVFHVAYVLVDVGNHVLVVLAALSHLRVELVDAHLQVVHARSHYRKRPPRVKIFDALYDDVRGALVGRDDAHMGIQNFPITEKAANIVDLVQPDRLESGIRTRLQTRHQFQQHMVGRIRGSLGFTTVANDSWEHRVHMRLSAASGKNLVQRWVHIFWSLARDILQNHQREGHHHWRLFQLSDELA